ncbi:MAG: Nif3-like dinuclear metal center hexameric protein, partial [Phycisphaerales bacterium]
MRARELMEVLDRIAPLELAGGWDNAGLLVGDHGLDIEGPVFVTLDLTDPVIDEAVERRAGFVVA